MLKLLSEGEIGIPGVTVSTERVDKGTAVAGGVAIVGDANGRPCAGVSDILCLFLKRAMKPLRPGPEVTGLCRGILNLLCSEPAVLGGLVVDSLCLELSLDTAWVGEAIPSDAGVIVSSPTFFARSDPLSLLKREVSFDVLLLFNFVSGSASRLLFVVETSFGIEISLGSTRLLIDDE
jgi:hypothetical protein